MTVKEVVLLAAEELRIAAEVKAYWDGTNLNGEEKARLLLTCFNMVENELALDYLPLTSEEKLSSSTGQIQFVQLKNAPVRILQVKNAKGEALDFKLYAKYLQTEKRQEIVDRITEARSHGDLSENAEYDAARNEQAANELEIAELDYKLKNAVIFQDREEKRTALKPPQLLGIQMQENPPF